MHQFHIMYFICLPITFLCLFGFCRKSGLWEMLIKAFALFFATFFALALFEPLANLFDKMAAPFAYYNDMWAFLLIFVPILAIELFITNRLSRVNVQLQAKSNKISAMVMTLLVFIGFYLVSAQSFYFLLPEAPDYKAAVKEGKFEVSNPFQYQLVELFSKGSLSGANTFSYKDFYFNQFKRRSAVYSAVGGSQKQSSTNGAAWKFSGSSTSPNVK